VRTGEIIEVMEVGTLTPVELEHRPEVPNEVSVPTADRRDDGQPAIAR
jgi:hypothetical protein